MEKELKNCSFCNEYFEPKRSDAVYCSNSCKSSAYQARQQLKVADNTPAASVTGVPRKQPARARHSISENQLNTLLIGSKSNRTVLEGLLSEKDSSGDLKASKAMMEVKMMFLERDLDQSQKENASLKERLAKLEDQLEKKGESKMDKLFNSVTDDPQGFMQTCIHGYHAIKTGQIPAGNLAPSGEPSLMSELTDIASMFPGADIGQLIQMVKAYAVANQEEISNTLNQNNSES